MKPWWGSATIWSCIVFAMVLIAYLVLDLAGHPVPPAIAEGLATLFPVVVAGLRIFRTNQPIKVKR